MRGKAVRPRAGMGLLGTAAALLAAWELAPRFAWVDAEVLPPASAVGNALWRLLNDGWFLPELGVTALEVSIAFAVAAPLALSTGFILGEKLHIGEVVNPFLHLALAVPQSVFLPIFILVFGIGVLSKVIFGITHAYFVIVVTTVAAVRSVPPELILAARAFGATPTQIYRYVYLPAMLPLIVTGLRLGMIFNIVGVLLAEMYASRHGIGGIILAWGERAQMRELLAGVVLVSALTVAVNELMRLWENQAGRWRRSSAQA